MLTLFLSVARRWFSPRCLLIHFSKNLTPSWVSHCLQASAGGLAQALRCLSLESSKLCQSFAADRAATDMPCQAGKKELWEALGESQANSWSSEHPRSHIGGIFFWNQLHKKKWGRAVQAPKILSNKALIISASLSQALPSAGLSAVLRVRWHSKNSWSSLQWESRLAGIHLALLIPARLLKLPLQKNLQNQLHFLFVSLGTASSCSSLIF